ncbi:MAG TPA: LacI family DNA-binding transcriptional regulator [Paracoccaceae bacterium]|nr:LacI family DNA-binding transcriptional regulator [Paracoccaceae bacterium]
MRRATVHDVAREAGVSLATVDRVLNRRPGVREATTARVLEAVARLGYARDIAAANLARRRAYRFRCLLPASDNSFFQDLESELRTAAAPTDTARTRIEIHHVPPFDAAALAAALDAVMPEICDGIAAVAVDSPQVAAAIGAAAARGLPVVTLVSDLPSSARTSFVGIDNVAAGRSAASLLGRFLGGGPARVGIVAGSMLVRDHAERLQGFGEVMRRDFPAISLVPPVEGRDDPAATEAAVAGLLRAEPGLAGLYSIGAGNRGVIAALKASGRAGKVVTIVHDLTRFTREALNSGIFAAVIRQDPGHEARSALRILRAQVDGAPVHWGQERIRIEIFIRENLP